MRKRWSGLVVGVLLASTIGLTGDGVSLDLSYDGSTGEATLSWNGGAPDYEIHRSLDATQVTGPLNLQLLTPGTQWTEPRLKPPPGLAHYYLANESDLQAGSFPATWINGADCDSEPEIQIHAYNADTFILRQSLCTNFEGPFMYLLFGEDKVLMQDTGATSNLPIADTVYDIIDQWLFDNGRTSIELIVTHSHGHGDHVAGDGQFIGQPDTTVVGTSQSAVAAFFGISNWPEQQVTYDLGGGRVIDVLAIPGHHPAHVALYDRETAMLFTGDTLYPGRLYISQFSTYLTSIQRLVDFMADKPVVHVLGTHIEMTDTPYEDFPFGATVHLDERELELSRDHVVELLEGVMGMVGNPVIEEHVDFIIFPL